ncbi:MAG TPA: MraY family glycosyltransferase [Planctomycetota bacterium]
MLQLAAYFTLVSLGVALVLTPVAMWAGRRWRVLDTPGPRKVHTELIPLTGGWAILGTLTLVLWGHLGLAASPLGITIRNLLPESARFLLPFHAGAITQLLTIYAGAVLIFFLGLIDDIRGMSVRSRLLVQGILALILVIAGVRPMLAFLPVWVAGLIGILWIVGVTNAFNFLDGLDGLSAGVSLIATAGLMAVMGVGQQPNMVLLLACLAGAQLGFLKYNFHPARVFLGSSGSLLLGYLMGVLTLQATFMTHSPHQGNWLMPLLIPVFLLGIPLYDTTSVVLIRLFQKRSVAIGDQSHFHHRLMRLGFSHLQVVIFIWLIATAIAFSAVRLSKSSLIESLLTLAQILTISAILILAERAAYRSRQRALRQSRELIDMKRGDAEAQDPETADPVQEA